ncbi:MAG: PAS domain-containing sensor histidine kinase [Bacteriovoracaceae bacterium]
MNQIPQGPIVIQAKLFRSMVHCVSVILIFYFFLFAYYQAYLSLGIIAFGLTVLCPAILYLEENNRQDLARITFSLSCCIFIFVASLGMKHEMHAEYYYLPALIIPLLLFEHSRSKLIATTMLIGISFWAHSMFFSSDFLPAFLLPKVIPDNIRYINFLGACFLSISFLTIYIKFTNQLKIAMVKEVERESHKRNLILTTMSEGLLVLNENDEVISHNPAFCKIIGLPHDEYRGKMRRDISLKHCHGDGSAYKSDEHPSLVAIRTNIPQLGKVMGILLPNKEHRWLKINAVPFEDEGRRHVVVTFTDITEKKKAELMSIHNAKLASLGEMSAGIAHEINNPLGIIIGNTEVLPDFINDRAKFDSKIESILRASNRIEKIVKGLRKYARLTDQSKSQENLSVIVNEAVVMVDAKAKRHAVNIESHLDEKLELLCDGVEIEQVLINLLNNAMDAIKDHDEKWIKINTFHTADSVVLQVIDSGHMSHEVEHKLFQPFFTTKVVGEGTGLGLSIVKGILDQHGATITLNKSFSTTCFEIKFPKSNKVENVA